LTIIAQAIRASFGDATPVLVDLIRDERSRRISLDFLHALSSQYLRTQNAKRRPGSPQKDGVKGPARRPAPVIEWVAAPICAATGKVAARRPDGFPSIPARLLRTVKCAKVTVQNWRS